MRWLTLLLVIWTVQVSAWDRAAAPYIPTVIREVQARFGVPGPSPVVMAQIEQESGWNPKAVSYAGAQGLMQFMPQTAMWTAVQAGFGNVDPTNPLWSIRAGVWYDWWLRTRVMKYESDCDRWHFALAGYNGGLGHVYARQSMSQKPGSWLATGYLNPGIRPTSQSENENYPVKIIHKLQPKYASFGDTVCR